MERLTKRNKVKLSHGEEIIVCNHSKEDCNDSCMKIMPCKWYKKVQEKLKEYEDAEEQGLLLRLPCPIGTTVYSVVSDCEGDSVGCYGNCDTCNNLNEYIEEVKFEIEHIDAVGSYIFLTREEAEQALKQMGE